MSGRISSQRQHAAFPSFSISTAGKTWTALMIFSSPKCTTSCVFEGVIVTEFKRYLKYFVGFIVKPCLVVYFLHLPSPLASTNGLLFCWIEVSQKDHGFFNVVTLLRTSLISSTNCWRDALEPMPYTCINHRKRYSNFNLNMHTIQVAFIHQTIFQLRSYRYPHYDLLNLCWLDAEVEEFLPIFQFNTNKPTTLIIISLCSLPVNDVM